ncbi:MAG TPA: dihydroorotase [Flavobacteriales bacterium]|nr:dihydroorotase [Flavobacteriales bacterium]
MQATLIKQAKVIDKHSTFNNKTVDVLIENGIITKIAANIDSKEAKVVQGENLHISPGFFDPTVHFCDPGDEQKESIESGIKAAASGGFTSVGVLGTTNPAVTEKTRVEYIRNKGKGTLVTLEPVGCVTAKNEGKELAELYDMNQSGSRYFYDGKKQLNTGILSRALAYAKNFDAAILSYPDDKDLTAGGLMHEGTENIKLGLKGIPAIGEELGIIRDAYIANYHNAHLHIANVSTAGGVEQIKKAKSNGIKITAQCSIHHLFFTDEDQHGFDTNLKLKPVLRSKSDRDALIEGLKDGTIDNVTSDHTPQDVESKKMEFDLAEYGAIGIETCFAAFNTVAGKNIGLEKIIDLLSNKSRQVFGLSAPKIEVNAKAEFVIYNPTAEFIPTREKQVSKAYNNPYIGKKLAGKIEGVINGNCSSVN